MKFLCLECNQPMKLYETEPPDRGSIAVKYECPSCLHQIAMLTNPAETQIVSSLGVSIGGKAVDADAAAAPDDSSCPIAAKVADVVEREAEGSPASSSEDGILWTDAARERLERIPSFVRPMAVIGIEQFAKEHGYQTVDEEVLDRARDRFGM